MSDNPFKIGDIAFWVGERPTTWIITKVDEDGRVWGKNKKYPRSTELRVSNFKEWKLASRFMWFYGKL